MTDPTCIGVAASSRFRNEVSRELSRSATGPSCQTVGRGSGTL